MVSHHLIALSSTYETMCYLLQFFHEMLQMEILDKI